MLFENGLRRIRARTLRGGSPFDATMAVRYTSGSKPVLMRTLDPAPAALLLAVVVISACGSGADAEPAGSAGSPAEPPAAAAAAGAGTSMPNGLPEVEFVSDPDASAPPPEAPAPDPPQGDSDDDALLAELRARHEADPADVQALRAYARALTDRGQKQAVVPLYERAAQLDPGPRSQLELGIAYANVTRLAEAEAAYREVLRQVPNQPAALLNLGNLAAKRADFPGAIEWYGRAIESDPEYMLAYFHLAQMFREVGQTDRAYAVYLTILDEMRPTNPREQGIYNEAVFELASLALSLGQAAQAESLLSQLVRAAPNHSGAHYARGQALLQLGREEEAQQEFEIHMRIMASRKPTDAMASAPEFQ